MRVRTENDEGLVMCGGESESKRKEAGLFLLAQQKDLHRNEYQLGAIP